MPAFDPSTDIATVKCPNGHAVKITLGEARRSMKLKCPNCSANIVIDGSSLDREMGKVDAEWDKLQRTLKNFGR